MIKKRHKIYSYLILMIIVKIINKNKDKKYTTNTPTPTSFSTTTLSTVLESNDEYLRFGVRRTRIGTCAMSTPVVVVVVDFFFIFAKQPAIVDPPTNVLH